MRYIRWSTCFYSLQPNDYAFSDDCKTKYVCQPGTADKPSAILEKPGCSRDEICKMKDGVAKCIPVPGILFM